MRLGELMLNVASIFVPTNNVILQHLERDSEWLQQQLGQYAPISCDFVTKFAYEIFPTPVALGKTIMVSTIILSALMGRLLMKTQVVPRASAVVPGAADAESIAIPANHINMVKFPSNEDGGYEKVSGHLWLLAKQAPDVIAARWGKLNSKIAKGTVPGLV